MKKSEKIAIIVAVILVVAGLVITSLAFRALGSAEWGIEISGIETNETHVSIGTAEMITNTHSIGKTFDSINIHTDVAYVNFELAKDGACKVVCEEYEQDKHEVFVENGTLTVRKQSAGQEYIPFGISAEHQNITVYLPQESYENLLISTDTGKVVVPEFLAFGNAEVSTDTGYIDFFAAVSGSLSIRSDTGRVTAQNIEPKSLNISTDTGDISLKNIRISGDAAIRTDTGDTEMVSVKCRGLKMESHTGDIVLEKVIASAAADMRTDTGDINLKGFDAEAIYIRTDTGEVMGTILSEKVFLVESNTGDIDVPKTISGGRCEITTDTGDITIEIA